jgi:hypothetical protein
MLLSCLYREKEFIRVGYYVNNDYADQEMRENPPEKPELSKIQRSILADKPRVTRFAIPWYLFIMSHSYPGINQKLQLPKNLLQWTKLPQRWKKRIQKWMQPWKPDLFTLWSIPLLRSKTGLYHLV